jgi:hypothetical protein
MIAEKLKPYKSDITKHDVYNFLYTPITQVEGLLDSVLRGDRLDEVMRLDAWARLTNIHAHVPESEEDEALDVASEFRIANWYINKMGSPERAKKVLDVAIKALKDLQEP